ncbi:MAG: aminoglycoside phosphotransferase family protein [Rikenellaceae bacterium]
MQNIANQFALEGQIAEITTLGEGFINDTFFIKTENNAPNYILQRKNKNIFTDVPAMMDNIQRVTDHLKAKIVAAGGDPMREALTVTPTKSGELYYKDAEGEFWAVCQYIEDNLTYSSAATPELAFQGGKGIGQFQAMLSDFEGTLVDILPGFHQMRIRMEQWDAAVKGDAAGRVKDLASEIDWIESRREWIMSLWAKVESGEIPTRITHNDTKINNILFDQQGQVLCVIDLDTVLSSTALNDYGDAIRSYTNTGLEDDLELDNVSMSLPIFEGYTQGYLSQTKAFLNDAEKEHLADWAMVITYEQVLRFLMDYINGDTYYKIKYDDHNLVRTRAQYKLLQSMEEQKEKMHQIVKENI